MDKKEFLRKFLNLHDEELIEKMSEVSETVHFHKGDLLIKEGSRQEYADILVHGVLRSFFTDYNGKDITDFFIYKKGSVALGCHGFEKTALLSIGALLPSDVLRIPVSDMIRLLREYHELSVVYIDILMNEVDSQWRVKRAMYQYDATDRYTWFRRTCPELVVSIPDKYIASFLNITPVTLSRIKGHLRTLAAGKKPEPET